MMKPGGFLRMSAGVVTGLAVISLTACSDGGGPTNPDEGGPTLEAIYPSSGAVRETANTVSVYMTGTGFAEGNVQVGVNTFDGTAIEVANVSVASDTYISADFIIPAGTPTGDRNVTVTNDAGTSESVTFEIGRDKYGKRPPHLVEIHDNYLAPRYLTVEMGQPVQFLNMGTHDHTVQTYGNPGLWDAELIRPDQRFTLTFYEQGVYGFMCGLHQSIGFITVVGPGSMGGSGY